MHRSLALSLVAIALATGCASQTSSAPEDPASGENDLTKTHVFTCTSSDADSWNNLAVSGSGSSTTIKVHDELHSYTAKIDPTYPNSRVSAANQDFRRFIWEKNDPASDDEATSVMFVHKDVLAGKAGQVKYQVTSEVFDDNYMTCTPNK